MTKIEQYSNFLLANSSCLRKEKMNKITLLPLLLFHQILWAYWGYSSSTSLQAMPVKKNNSTKITEQIAYRFTVVNI